MDNCSDRIQRSSAGALGAGGAAIPDALLTDVLLEVAAALVVVPSPPQHGPLRSPPYSVGPLLPGPLGPLGARCRGGVLGQYWVETLLAAVQDHPWEAVPASARPSSQEPSRCSGGAVAW